VQRLPHCQHLTNVNKPLTLHQGQSAYNALTYLIKRNIKLNDYDVILFSYYDEICLFFVKYPLFTYLINHINVSGLPFSRIKRFFTDVCQSVISRLSLMQSQRFIYISLGVDNVEVVAHGLVKPFYNKSATSV